MLPQAMGEDPLVEELQKKSSKAALFWFLWGRGEAGRDRRKEGASSADCFSGTSSPPGSLGHEWVTPLRCLPFHCAPGSLGSVFVYKPEMFPLKL